MSAALKATLNQASNCSHRAEFFDGRRYFKAAIKSLKRIGNKRESKRSVCVSECVGWRKKIYDITQLINFYRCEIFRIMGDKGGRWELQCGYVDRNN